MRPTVSLRKALADPQLLGSVLAGDSWSAWRTMLIAAIGEPLTPPERAVFTRFTGREIEPCQQIEEAAFVIGRRGGKDRAVSVLAAYIAGLCDHSDVLALGERGIVVCLSLDQRGAKITLDYITAIFQGVPILKQLVASRTADALELTNGITIEVRAASFRRIRGITAVAAIASEVAFWMDADASMNPAEEILAAVRPALGTTGGPLIMISTPYARRGELWETYRRHYGPDGDPLVLVAQGTTRDFNPTFSQRRVDRAIERDPAKNRAEYLCEFRNDITNFISHEAVEACVVPGRFELPPVSGVNYIGTVDPAGGSGSDSMTVGIAHRGKDGCSVLDLVREWRPPFSPEAVVTESAALFKAYCIHRVTGDHWGGEFVREPYRLNGITYDLAEKPKSDSYRDFLPLINSRRAELLDHRRLSSQLLGLERRTARSGKDSIDHAPGSHDDLVNAAALALVLAAFASAPMVITQELLARSRIPSAYVLRRRAEAGLF
jgi:hypothetical protein